MAVDYRESNSHPTLAVMVLDIVTLVEKIKENVQCWKVITDLANALFWTVIGLES